MSGAAWSRLAYEIWEKILDDVDTVGLESAQRTCTEWRGIVLAYAASGRLKNRARRCHRLTIAFGGGESCLSLDHRKGIKNRLSVAVSRSILLLGVGVYTGRDEEIADESLSVTFDRTTNSVDVHQECGEVVAHAEATATTADARRMLSEVGHIPNTCTVWLGDVCVLEANERYDVEHNLWPTDVRNHFSGWPITVIGAEVWTCYGKGGGPEVITNGVRFTFGQSTKGRRCCFEEGQMPFFWFWKM